jgi:hypothetical protein
LVTGVVPVLVGVLPVESGLPVVPLLPVVPVAPAAPGFDSTGALLVAEVLLEPLVVSAFSPVELHAARPIAIRPATTTPWKLRFISFSLICGVPQ